MLATSAVVLALGLGLSACSSPKATTSSSTTAGPSPSAGAPKTVADNVGATGIPAFYTPPNPLPPGAPGAIIRTEKVTGVPGVPATATVWRVLFHSRSIYGADIAESGYIVVPGGTSPKGGYPILTWAHGTTGFAGICAPSLFTSQGGVGPYVVPGLSDYLKAGFVVAATDYEGLGTPGIHPYLLGASEGRGVLDAARAARLLPGLHTSNTVMIYGHSQGGQAALFAGELAPTYAPELHIAGVVAAAPATGLSTILGVVTTSVGQSILEFTIPVAYTWAKTYHDLPLSDLFTPAGQSAAESIVTQGCLPALIGAIGARHLSATSVFAPGAATNPVVIAHAKMNDPGQTETPAPMLIVQGTADTTVPPALTDTYVTKMACPLKDTVDYLHVTGATHGTVVTVSVPTITQWMSARLQRSPAPSTCGRSGDVATLTP
ncbi:MAG TPA: lipase family protein [Acidimicrobiales bacterium]|nr:lipase family protein [Acidimicrobiales bacterium]